MMDKISDVTRKDIIDVIRVNVKSKCENFII